MKRWVLVTALLALSMSLLRSASAQRPEPDTSRLDVIERLIAFRSAFDLDTVLLDGCSVERFLESRNARQSLSPASRRSIDFQSICNDMTARPRMLIDSMVVGRGGLDVYATALLENSKHREVFKAVLFPRTRLTFVEQRLYDFTGGSERDISSANPSRSKFLESLINFRSTHLSESTRLDGCSVDAFLGSEQARQLLSGDLGEWIDSTDGCDSRSQRKTHLIIDSLALNSDSAILFATSITSSGSHFEEFSAVIRPPSTVEFIELRRKNFFSPELAPPTNLMRLQSDTTREPPP